MYCNTNVWITLCSQGVDGNLLDSFVIHSMTLLDGNTIYVTDSSNDVVSFNNNGVNCGIQVFSIAKVFFSSWLHSYLIISRIIYLYSAKMANAWETLNTTLVIQCACVMIRGVLLKQEAMTLLCLWLRYASKKQCIFEICVPEKRPCMNYLTL